MSEVRTNSITDAAGTGAPDFPNGVNAATALIVKVDETERMRIDSSGNVGIGTASPDFPLDVSSTGVGSTIVSRFYVTDNTVGLLRVGNSTTGDGATAPAFGANATSAVIHTNNTERMRIDASGNLGLGVTPSAWATLVPAIQIGGGGSFIAAQGSGTANSDSIYIGTNAHFNGTNWLYKETNNASYFLQANGQHRFFTAPSGTAGNAITFTQAMTLDASGNLGIGTSSPTAGYRLDVFGQAQIGDGGGNADINFNASSTGRFLVAGTERLRIASGGQIGIGGANYGTSGQVMTSGGSGAAPSWATPAAPTSAEVGSAIAGIAAGAVGSALWGTFASTAARTYGASVAGSSLKAGSVTPGGADSEPGVQAGTWRFLGYQAAGTQRYTGFVRIS